MNDSFSPGITTFPLNLSVANITFVALLALLDAKLVLNDAIKSRNASAVIESVVTAGYNVFNFILYSGLFSFNISFASSKLIAKSNPVSDDVILYGFLVNVASTGLL